MKANNSPKHFRQWLLMVLFLSLGLAGQAQDGRFHFSKYFDALSPQTYAFAQYGNTPVSHFTGEASVQVPLYTYKDKDFNIPVFLGYSSSGFKPNKREGIAGMDWFLNAGGVITRKVNGWPDERQGRNDETPAHHLHGLYYAAKNKLGIEGVSREDIYQLEAGNVDVNNYWNIGGSEVTPDDFTFNMPGHNGGFHIANDGKVRFSNNAQYKIDLSNFGTQNVDQYEIPDSEIIITTDDGYKYYFGGGIQYLEASFPVESANLGLPLVGGYGLINAWHLSKIEAPNGRTVTYHYRTFQDAVLINPTPTDSEHYLLNVYDVNFEQYNKDCTDFEGGMCSFQGVSGHETVFQVSKTVYLERISIGRSSGSTDEVAHISFHYQDKGYPFYKGSAHKYNLNGLKLEAVKVFNHTSPDEPVKSFTLAYTDLGGNYPRLFLSSVDGLGEPPYTFEYTASTNNLPSPETHAVDHWGYWNAGNPNGYLIPALKYQRSGDVFITGSERSPDPAKHNVGMLEKITYPTGGFTTFEYEPHRYGQRLERRNASDFLPALFPVNDLAGGARIKKIVDNDGLTNFHEREFKYTLAYPKGSASSGILLDWPTYLTYWEYKNENAGLTNQAIRGKSSSYYNDYAPGEKFIQYQEVAEVNLSDNSYTVYKFTNYKTNPDVNEHKLDPEQDVYKEKIFDEDMYNNVTNRYRYINYVGIKFSDKSFERGKAYEVTQYSVDQRPLKKQKILFTEEADYPDKYIAASFGTGCIGVSYKIYTYPHMPLKEITETYGADGEMLQRVVADYSYTEQGYLAGQAQTLSDGSIQTKWTSFPSDFTNTTGFIGDLKAANNLKIPVEQVVYKTNPEGTTHHILSGSLTTYQTGGKGLPADTYTLEAGTPIPLSEFKFSHTLNGELPEAGTRQPFDYDERYYNIEHRFISYDGIGNPTQINAKDGTVIKYEWGPEYHYMYPTRKVISTTLGEKSSTYTYTPLVGMMSETDQNGKTTTYVYDDFNRLMFIKDHEGNILQRYDYEYQLAD